MSAGTPVASRRAWRYFIVVWLTFLLAGWLHAARAQQPIAVPPLAARVTDLTATLTPQQRDALERVLAEYEQRRGSQIFVLMLPSTAPEPIEDFGIRVADAWKTGRARIDDGVIIVIAKDNPRELRRMRLEIGRGLEGAIPDASAKRILQDVMAPHFRQNDFYGGLAAGIAALQSTIDREGLAPPAASGQDTVALGALWPYLLLTFVLLLLLMARTRRLTAATRHNGRVIVVPPIWGGGFGGGRDHDSDGFGGGFGGGGGGGFGGGGASGDW